MVSAHNVVWAIGIHYAMTLWDKHWLLETNEFFANESYIMYRNILILLISIFMNILQTLGNSKTVRHNVYKAINNSIFIKDCNVIQSYIFYIFLLTSHNEINLNLQDLKRIYLKRELLWIAKQKNIFFRFEKYQWWQKSLSSWIITILWTVLLRAAAAVAERRRYDGAFHSYLIDCDTSHTTFAFFVWQYTAR